VHLDFVVAFFVDFVYQLDYLFFSRAFYHLGFFLALVTTLFVVSSYLIKDILLTLSYIIIIK
jgi:hypothetical protein